MPDIHIERHGDRWAVKEGPEATPFFESYTREEAEAEARRRAQGGEIRWAGEAGGRDGVGQERDEDAPSPDDLRPEGSPARPGEAFRETQAGL
jgi:Uncharacterized protein conserved in bacteria (DUF2188)